MELLHSWLIEALVVSLMMLTGAFVIVTRADRLYQLSSHKGIRFFRDAFVFFGASVYLYFLHTFVENAASLTLGAMTMWALEILLRGFAIYFFSMAALYLVLSLVWKHMSSLPLKEQALHGMGMGLALIDFLFGERIVFIVFVALLSYAVLLSYQNYKSTRTNKMRELYFIILVVTLVVFVLNFLSHYIVQYIPYIDHYFMLMNGVVVTCMAVSVQRVIV